MKIVISSGHGKHIRGASGSPVPPQCDEVNEARRVVDRTAAVLRGRGVDVTTFHDDQSTTQSANLDRIVAAHNNAGPHDLDVSVHFNAFDGSAHGCEVLYVSQAGMAVADLIVDEICTVSGLTNRGPKKRTDLAFLNGTNEVAVLIETAFCDNTSDCNIYREHFEDICTAIANGILGEEAAPGPTPEPEGGTLEEQIAAAAEDSAIAEYSWKDRGHAPIGYTIGMAQAFALAYINLIMGDNPTNVAAKPIGGDRDSLDWYGIEATEAGTVLVETFTLLMGLGLRESSGQFFEGRDMSAENVSAETAEAGLFQQSWNSHTADATMDDLLWRFTRTPEPSLLSTFKEGCGTPSSDDLDSYGSPSSDGYKYQELAKSCPFFAVMMAAVGVRVIGGEDGHWGPIRRKEAEMRPEARQLFNDVRTLVDGYQGEA